MGHLVQEAEFEQCEAGSVSGRASLIQPGRPANRGLLKTVLTNACERDCFYCPFRKSRNARRTRMTPDEMAKAFVQMYRAGFARGIFLSSGIRKDPVFAQDQILATAEILRNRFGFKGYIHLKIMPGAETAQVERALLLANRVSVNLEAPNPKRLARLSPDKRFNRELAGLSLIISRLRQETGKTVSQTTQMVVGPAGESDKELLSTARDLYKNLGLHRVYYSPFRPVRNTPLENHPAEKPERTRRLYQADFLIRDYGFSADDLIFDEKGRLAQGIDPKMAWARQHPEFFPVDLHKADYHQLILVPGIGPKTAENIIKHRWNNLLTPRDLTKLGVKTSRAKGFVVIRGKPIENTNQLSLF